MKNYSLLFVLFLSTFFCSAQDVLLEKEVDTNSFKTDKGPNSKFYWHLYTGGGWFVDNNELDLNKASLQQSHAGYRAKFKINELYSIGGAVEISQLYYSFDESIYNTFPGTGTYDKEKLRLSYAKAEFFQRINFRKRGNYIGEFLDVGVFGTLLLSSRIIVQDNSPEESLGVSKLRVTSSGIDGINKTGYGLSARIGVNRYIIFANYYLSEITKKELNALPKVFVGVQLGLHK